MAKNIITELSKEQQVIISSYIKKWQVSATLTKPIDRQKATEAIKNAYQQSNYAEPEIIFCGSPWAAIDRIIRTKNFPAYLGCDISHKFRKRVLNSLLHLLKRQLDESLFYKLMNQIQYSEYPNHLDRDNSIKAFNFPMGIQSCTETQLLNDIARMETKDLDISELLDAMTRPADWYSWGCLFDFCISVLDLQRDRRKWQVVQELMQQCDFIFQFENVCLVCDRPSKLLFDRQNVLHAEWEYALQFADGYGVYAYHGGERLEGKRCNNNEYLEPGTRVKLRSTKEYGIVVHCWYSDEIFDFDCYVAFYGTSFLDPETECRPYILRYAAVSLEVLE